MLDIALVGLVVAATHLGDMNDGAKRAMFTPGLYAVLQSGLTLGAYKNTLGRPSVHIGYTHAASGSRVALSAGLVTGYPGTKTGYSHEPSSRYPLPYVAVSYRFGESSGMRVIAMPHRTIPLAFAYEVR